MKEAETRARREREDMLQKFRTWAATKCEHAELINTASTAQIQQLLFGEYEDNLLINRVREFEYEKSEELFQQETQTAKDKNPYAHMKAAELKALCKERQLKCTGSKNDLILRLLCSDDLTLQELKPQEKVRSKMKVAELKEECKKNGLSAVGKKSDLLSRLEEFHLRSDLMSRCLALGLSNEGVTEDV